MSKLFRIVFVGIMAICPSFLLANDYQFKGKHFVASYSECNEQALADYSTLAAVLLQAVNQCGATVLDSCQYVFEPNGLTMVILLSESHASIHTYPEHGACFIDLFTCGDKCSSEKFDEILRSYLKPQVVNAQTLIRDEGINIMTH